MKNAMKNRTNISNKMTKYVFVIMMTSLLLILSCGKDGAPGQDGKDGEDGPAGTANVVTSNWFPGKAWVGDNLPTYKVGLYTVPQTVMDAVGGGNILSFVQGGGTFLLYVKVKPTATDHEIRLAPASFGNAKFSYTLATTGYGIPPEDFLLELTSIDGNDLSVSYNDPMTLVEFRYVLIPAGRQMPVAKGLGRDKIDSKVLLGMSYIEAKELLGLED